MGETEGAPSVPHVVILGAGFAGLTTAQSLARARVRITVVDRTNHHLFQPLLYQVATAGLSPADISAPVRSVLATQRNVRVLLDEATRVDLAQRTVHLAAEGPLTYDYLVLAVGVQNNYFGHEAWAPHAVGLKNLDEAVEIRRRVLVAFEAAERETDVALRDVLLTFVVIGGGPTGVEMAGAISELSRFALARDFRAIRPDLTRVILVEAGPRILAGFPEVLSQRARAQLESLAVEVRVGKRVTQIERNAVHFDDETLHAATVVWAAGVKGTPLAVTLGVPLDRGGRVIVEPDASIPGHPEVFAIGDMAALKDANGVEVPGLSPAAMQEARHVARTLVGDFTGRPRTPFRYVDKGTMATIGRSRAVAQTRGLKLSGFLAWLAWLVVHLWYLIGFRNRVAVMLSWMWSYVTYKRGARLITGHRLDAGAPTHSETIGLEREGA